MKNVKIVAIERWIDLNEYEGVITVDLDGADLNCRAILNPGQWEKLEGVKSVRAELSILCYSDPAKDISEPKLEPISGINYFIVGILKTVDQNIVQIDTRSSGLWVVDLDDHTLNAALGDKIGLKGELQIDLDDDALM